MDTHALDAASVDLLNRHIDEALAVRELALRARWVAQRSESLALPPVFERAGANLQYLADLRLLERMLLALVRATRRRCDVALAMGDAETADLLRHAWRRLELLMWHVGLFAYADD